MIEKDMRFTEADWIAMVVYGREQANGSVMTPVILNGFHLSRRSVALLYANISWLLTLFDTNA